MLKGFIIFLTATLVLVRLSLAELFTVGASISTTHQESRVSGCHRIGEERVGNIPDQAKGAHSHRLEIRVSAEETISIVVADEESSRRRSFLSCWLDWGVPRVPGCDFEGGAEDLGSYEFGHDEGLGKWKSGD